MSSSRPRHRPKKDLTFLRTSDTSLIRKMMGADEDDLVARMKVMIRSYWEAGEDDVPSHRDNLSDEVQELWDAIKVKVAPVMHRRVEKQVRTFVEQIIKEQLQALNNGDPQEEEDITELEEEHEVKPRSIIQDKPRSISHLHSSDKVQRKYESNSDTSAKKSHLLQNGIAEKSKHSPKSYQAPQAAYTRDDSSGRPVQSSAAAKSGKLIFSSFGKSSTFSYDTDLMVLTDIPSDEQPPKSSKGSSKIQSDLSSGRSGKRQRPVEVKPKDTNLFDEYKLPKKQESVVEKISSHKDSVSEYRLPQKKKESIMDPNGLYQVPVLSSKSKGGEAVRSPDLKRRSAFAIWNDMSKQSQPSDPKIPTSKRINKIPERKWDNLANEEKSLASKNSRSREKHIKTLDEPSTERKNMSVEPVKNMTSKTAGHSKNVLPDSKKSASEPKISMSEPKKSLGEPPKRSQFVPKKSPVIISSPPYTKSEAEKPRVEAKKDEALTPELHAHIDEDIHDKPSKVYVRPASIPVQQIPVGPMQHVGPIDGPVADGSPRRSPRKLANVWPPPGEVVEKVETVIPLPRTKHWANKQVTADNQLKEQPGKLKVKVSAGVQVTEVDLAMAKAADLVERKKGLGSLVFRTPVSTAKSSPKSMTPRSPSPRSPTPRSPTPRSPTPRSPTPRSPISRSPTPRSPISRSPTPRSPTPRSPISRSPILRSPISRSPISRSPISRSPISRSPAPLSPKSMRPLSARSDIPPIRPPSPVNPPPYDTERTVPERPAQEQISKQPLKTEKPASQRSSRATSTSNTSRHSGEGVVLNAPVVPPIDLSDLTGEASEPAADYYYTTVDVDKPRSEAEGKNAWLDICFLATNKHFPVIEIPTSKLTDPPSNVLFAVFTCRSKANC